MTAASASSASHQSAAGTAAAAAAAASSAAAAEPERQQKKEEEGGRHGMSEPVHSCVWQVYRCREGEGVISLSIRSSQTYSGGYEHWCAVCVSGYAVFHRH